MRFVIEQRVDGPVDAVATALFDPAFVAATADLPKLGGAELLATERAGDVVHQRIRYRFTGHLPAAVTAVVDPDRLTWVDDARHDLATRRSRHHIEPDHYPDRLRAAYEARLEPTGTGTRRTIAGELRVRVALVGPRVERAIVSGLEEHAGAEAVLLGRWVSSSGS